MIYRLEWKPFCGDTSCLCMEPNITGACPEYKQDDDPTQLRCIECGWPEVRHSRDQEEQ